MERVVKWFIATLKGQYTVRDIWVANDYKLMLRLEMKRWDLRRR
jgi:hypothetical protein